jgi:hypothetical protein
MLICKELLPYEYAFLQGNLSVHIANGNLMLVAQFLQALHVFGLTDNDPLICKVIVDHSWDCSRLNIVLP